MSWLRDGLESREPFHELEDLRERRLVRVTERELLICGTPEQQAYGNYCEGWAEPGDPYGEAVGCETCGRLLEDPEPETVYTLAIVRDAMSRELESMVGGRRLRDGVAWSVEGEQDDVLVVVADWSDGTRWMSNRVLRGRPFVLVQVDEVVTASRLGSADWVVTASLLGVLRDPTVLIQAKKRAVELADAPRDVDPIIELHRLTSRVVHAVRGAHLVEFGQVEVRVDDVAVKMPTGMRKVLGFLVDRHAEDVRDGKSADGFCTWSLEEMSEALALPRSTVRNQLQRFQDRLASNYATQACRPLPEGSVLQLQRGTWRLSPDCLVRKSEPTPLQERT